MQIILKSKLHSPPVGMNLSCATRTVKVVSSTKYLGVLIDDKVNFQEHSTHLREKSLAFSREFLENRKITYTSNNEYALFKLDYALVHSHFIPGHIVWGNVYLSKLITLQNKTLRIVTGSRWYQKFNLLNQ